jgi:hypothetical protein
MLKDMFKIIVVVLLLIAGIITISTEKEFVGYTGTDGKEYLVYIKTGEQAVYQDGQLIPVNIKLSNQQIQNLLGRR